MLPGVAAAAEPVVFPDDRGAVIGAVIASGIFIGTDNTLVTTAVMSIAPVPRPVASAAYGFVRFIGGGLAPYVAGKLMEHYNVHVPFVLGAVTVLAGAVVPSTVHRALVDADSEEGHPGPSQGRAVRSLRGRTRAGPGPGVGVRHIPPVRGVGLATHER